MIRFNSFALLQTFSSETFKLRINISKSDHSCILMLLAKLGGGLLFFALSLLVHYQ